MTALVTGATGFIGSRLAAALVERGEDVRVLRREGSRTEGLAGLPVEHVIGDVLDAASVARAVAGCDVVYHVAAVATYWRTTRETVYRVNVEGTRNVMAACLKDGRAARRAYLLRRSDRHPVRRDAGRRGDAFRPDQRRLALRRQQAVGRRGGAPRDRRRDCPR